MPSYDIRGSGLILFFDIGLMLFHLISGILFIAKCYLTIEQISTLGVPTPSLSTVAGDVSGGRSFAELIPNRV